MQEKKLKFSKKIRLREAPHCPCGRPNDKINAQFAPFEDCNGEFGYCHTCERTFTPENTDEVKFVYSPPPKAEQKFLPEPDINWLFSDVTIDPKPDEPKVIRGQYTVTFYYRNIEGKIASAKRMVYNFPEFKREKLKHPIFPHTRESGYFPCLFYEYDITVYPKATIVLVESEKTAAILRYKFKDHLDEFIYVGVSGSNGLTDEKMHVLSGRDVIICYDCDNGTPQPDGTIKSPKGREAAQSAYVKLSPIARPIVVDIDPDNHDGLDLADIRHEIDFEYIQNLHTKEVTVTKIPDELITEMRALNKNGEAITPEVIQSLGEEYGINGDKIQTIGRVIKKEFSKETDLRNAPIVSRTKMWMAQRWKFRRNTLDNKLFYVPTGATKFTECEIPTIWLTVNENVGDITKAKDKVINKTIIENILASEFVEKFNPIKDYFESQPQWDGEDHISNLANHITTDDQDYWLQQFKKCLVRMIACTLEHKANRIIMTLVQETQESGKSSFIRFLCPPDLDPYYKEAPMDHDKDTEIALTENFIWNLEELADLNRKQISEMKAIVSMSTVKRRRSYGDSEKSMKRIVNFWGSTNKNDFLADTQNSRWLCFNVLNISHDYNNTRTNVKNIDINKVWGQAYHLYKNKFDYHLSDSERTKRDSRNQMFEAMPEEKQMILRFFKPAKKDEHGAKFMVNYEIKEHLNQNTSAKTRVNDNNIARSMKQLGFEQVIKKYQGKAARGYWVFALVKPLDYDVDFSREPELFSTENDGIELPF